MVAQGLSLERTKSISAKKWCPAQSYVEQKDVDDRGGSRVKEWNNGVRGLRRMISSWMIESGSQNIFVTS